MLWQTFLWNMRVAWVEKSSRVMIAKIQDPLHCKFPKWNKLPWAQPVSVLRDKLCKVVMKCKKIFNFWALFLKTYIFEIVTFFSCPVLSNHFNFSVVVLIYISNRYYHNWKSVFFSQPQLGRQVRSSQAFSLSI